jgi:hypothetical protein
VLLGAQEPAARTQGIRLLDARFSLPVEMLILALVLAAWELGRIPLEGSLRLALRHSDSWLSVEQALHLRLEPGLIRLAHRADLLGPARWFYKNGDEPVLFAFMASAYLRAPCHYPFLRTTYALVHVPGLAVIGLYPLAPPRWVSSLPYGHPPPAASLTQTTSEWLENSTASAASLHFGDAVLVAAAVLWLAPRPRWAWGLLPYPAVTFLVIVGTANHYFLDALVGTVCLVLAAAAARALHRETSLVPRLWRPRRGTVLAAAAGFGLLAYGINASIFTRAEPYRPSIAPALLLGMLLALIATRRTRFEGAAEPWATPWRERHS